MPISNYLSIEMVHSLCKTLFLGIWSLCQSSTSDWKGKLEKLRWESQQMKGE